MGSVLEWVKLENDGKASDRDIQQVVQDLQSLPQKGQVNSCEEEIGGERRVIHYVIKEEKITWNRRHERAEASTLRLILLW